MSAVQSLQTAIDVLRRNPVLLAAGVVSGLIGLPSAAASMLGIPLIPGVLSLVAFLIMPFVLAGAIGMAHEGISGPTSFNQFLTAGKQKYISVLAGTLIELMIIAGYWLVFFIITLIITFVFVGSTITGIGPGTQPSEIIGEIGIETVLLLVGIATLLLLPLLVILFLIQFFAPAIVVDDVGAIDGFKRSYRIVRNNILPAIGYAVIAIAIGLLGSVPSFLISYSSQNSSGVASLWAETSVAAQSPATVATISLITFLVTVIIYPFQTAFATAFYIHHTDAVED